MRCDVFLRKSDKPDVAHNVDVSLGRVERDELGALMGPMCGSVDPCRLTPNFVERGKSVKEQLTHND